MANPFDQFDSGSTGNPFDQFDNIPKTQAPEPPNPIESLPQSLGGGGEEVLSNVPFSKGHVPEGESYPQWMKDNPNLAGLAGAGQAIVSQGVKPVLEQAGAILGSAASPIVGTSLGYGMGKKAGEILESGYNKYVMGEDVKPKTVGEELAGSAVDVGTAAAMTKGFDVVGNKFLPQAEDTIKNVVKSAYERAIRPKFSGKGTSVQKEKFFDDVTQAVKSHIDIIKKTEGQKLPETVSEMADMITVAKIDLHENMKAQSRSVMLDRTSIIEDIEKVANSSALRDGPGGIAESNRLLGIVEEWKKNPIIPMSEAEGLIASYNGAAKAFWKAPNPNEITQPINNARIAYLTKEHAAETIGGLKGEAWKEYREQYGSQLAIEKEVNDRATVASRTNLKGFFDLSTTFENEKFIRGLVSLDPSVLAGAAGMKATRSYLKWMNSPDRIVKGMYKTVDRVMNRELTPMTPQQEKAFLEIQGKWNAPEMMTGDEYMESVLDALKPKNNAISLNQQYMESVLGSVEGGTGRWTGSPLKMPETGPLKARIITPEQFNIAKGELPEGQIVVIARDAKEKAALEKSREAALDIIFSTKLGSTGSKLIRRESEPLKATRPKSVQELLKE